MHKPARTRSGLEQSTHTYTMTASFSMNAQIGMLRLACVGAAAATGAEEEDYRVYERLMRKDGEMRVR